MNATKRAARDKVRFWAKVEKQSNGCWVWLGAKYTGGYGSFCLNSKCVPAHRVSYEWENGPISKGLTLDHLCRNRACINPAHLESLTMKENILRGQGLAAVNHRKTHCPKGHPYDTSNTYLVADGSRMCKACQKLRYIK